MGKVKPFEFVHVYVVFNNSVRRYTFKVPDMQKWKKNIHKNKVGKTKEKEWQQGKNERIKEKKKEKVSHVNSDLFHLLPVAINYAV